jgi:2-polyprenyl-3-methyl-5-hydroxy-6-metoxy-1,4-benzoquinol methylase
MDAIADCIVCGSYMYKMFDYRDYKYYRCPGCDHVTTLPYPDDKELVKHYKEEFDGGSYKSKCDLTAEYKRLMNKMAAILERRLNADNIEVQGLTVLDIGCFTGEFLECMHDRGADVYGIEIQKNAADVANNKFPDRVSKENILEESFSNGNQKYDILSMLGVIEHVKQPILLLEKALGLLKENGYLMLQTPNASSLLSRLLGKFWMPYTPIEHIHLFSRTGIKKALQRHNIGDVNIIRHFKKLSFDYSYNMLKTFGVEFYRVFTPFYRISPRWVKQFPIPVYLGEIIIIGKKITMNN